MITTEEKNSSLGRFAFLFCVAVRLSFVVCDFACAICIQRISVYVFRTKREEKKCSSFWQAIYFANGVAARRALWPAMDGGGGIKNHSCTPPLWQPSPERSRANLPAIPFKYCLKHHRSKTYIALNWPLHLIEARLLSEPERAFLTFSER